MRCTPSRAPSSIIFLAPTPLLGRLKEQRHGPRQRSLVLFEPRCGGQEACSVPSCPQACNPDRARSMRKAAGWLRRWEVHRYRLEALDALPSHQRQACLPCRFRRTHATGFRADPAPASRRRPSTSRAKPPRDVDGVHDASAHRCRRCGRSWRTVLGHPASHLAGATPAAFCPSAGRDTLARN